MVVGSPQDWGFTIRYTSAWTNEGDIDWTGQCIQKASNKSDFQRFFRVQFWGHKTNKFTDFKISQTIADVLVNKWNCYSEIKLGFH